MPSTITISGADPRWIRLRKALRRDLASKDGMQRPFSGFSRGRGTTARQAAWAS